MCCDGCPAAFHPACLEEEFAETDELWFCPDCQAGRRVLEGDIVWARLGTSRWWPSLVCELIEIPTMVMKSKPKEIGWFPVKWLGLNNQYSWLDHTCVMPWEDRREKAKKKEKQGFVRALQEAVKLHELRNEEKLQELSMIKEEMPSFDKVRKNTYTDGDKNVWSGFLEEPEECNCSAEDMCGEYSQCINREMYIECTDKSCKFGKLCQNRRIQRRSWAELEPRKTLKCGWGLFAQKDIPEGTFLIEYQGEVISRDTMQERLAHCMSKGVRTYYYMTLDNRYSIDARTKACNARFINHACNPNAQTIIWQCAGEKRSGIFALRDIKANEEILYDYDFDYMDTTEGKCACYCGAPNCSGEIGVKKQKEVKKAAGVKAPTATTGWNLYKAEYCKEHKQAAPKDEVVEDKALRLAKSKQDREDARINWDAMAGEQQAVYNAKAESINKARQVQASKPKKRKPALSSKAASQDDCWICRDGGELFICDLCPKAYHPHCLGLDGVPKGKWKCPSHACLTCNKKPSVECGVCGQAYCAPHALESMSSDKEGTCVGCASEDTAAAITDSAAANVPKSEAVEAV